MSRKIKAKCLKKGDIKLILADLHAGISQVVIAKKFGCTQAYISHIKITKLSNDYLQKQAIAEKALDNANYALTEARKKNLTGDSYHSLVSAAREAAYTSRMILGEEDKQADKIPITIQIGQNVVVNKSPDNKPTNVISADKVISNNEDDEKAT